MLPTIRLSLITTLVTATTVAVIASADSPVPTAITDPLDRVSSYSIQITEDANGDTRATDDWFYMGFVHGIPHQFVHMGFNGRQSTSRGTGPFRGEPLPTPPVYRDAHGLRYYSLAWSAESFAMALDTAKKRAAKTSNLAPAEARLAALPEAQNHPSASNKARVRRARLNLFDTDTRQLLNDYVRAHVTAWSASTSDRATSSLINYWGLDNEWEGQHDYSPQARAAFATWLREAYNNDIAALNQAWSSDLPVGSTPASHTSFEAAASSNQIPSASDYSSYPGIWLDWTHFQTEHFTATLAELARTMHDTDPLKRGVVHKSTQQTLEMPNVNRVRTFDHEVFADLMRPISGGLLGTDMYGSGDRQSYELNYLYNCIRPLDRSPGYGVFLPETNNHNGPGHAFAATTWRMLANGLKATDFFTLGFAGAKDDWDKFGFHNSATGAPRDKLHYAARWAHMVHRTEAFWKNAIPAEGMPRIALLLPRSDILLAEKSPRSTSRWGYPRNHRWLVYRWLREQGYWVDVIPSTKLHPDYLRAYDALALIGAEHISPLHAQAISNYVRGGGVLIADTRPGRYDLHHRVIDSFEPLLGVNITDNKTSSAAQTTIPSGHIKQKLVADTGVTAAATKARVLAMDTNRRPVAFLNTLESGAPNGKPGRVLYLPFELGSTILEKPAEAQAAFLLDGPTADREEYALQQGELAIGRWLGDRLREAGLTPAINADKKLGDTGNLRVEQPFIDKSGNVAVVISTRADTEQRPLPAGTITLPLPASGESWTSAWWAPAEDDSLTAIPVRATTGNRYEIKLPIISSAGVLYLFRNHAPVLSIPAIASAAHGADGHTAKLPAGKPFPVTVELINPSATAMPSGILRMQALEGWTIQPAGTTSTPRLSPGEKHTATFTITPPADPAFVKPDWLYPLVATWRDSHLSAQPQTVLSANIELSLPADQTLLLLTDNAHYPETYPHRRHTGATYRYAQPSADSAAASAISDPSRKDKNTRPGTALTNGFNNKTGQRSSGAPGPYNASYVTRNVTVDFDLQATRSVRRAIVTAGPGDMRPIRLAFSTSENGNTFTEQLSYPIPSDTKVANREYILTLPKDVSARHVRLTVEWPLAGGTLDEIEVWGR